MTVSAIEWCDATWNPTAGCSACSPGCANCYAVPQTYRLERMGQAKYTGLTVLGSNGRRRFNGEVRTVPEALKIPIHWRKPRRIFVNSMSDLFHENCSFEFIDEVFAVMALTPQHTYQVLTKRPNRMANYTISRAGAAGRWMIESAMIDLRGDTARGMLSPKHRSPAWPLPNVWLGTSVEDQPRANERIPRLLRCPAVVRFLSCEPLLGPLDLTPWLECGCAADPPWLANADGWVIVGGESGSHARPCEVAWIRSIVEQCRAAGVPCFVKQLGAAYSDAVNGVAGRSLCVDRDVASLVSRRLKHPKGGDPAEWPEALRVRDWPQQAEARV